MPQEYDILKNKADIIKSNVANIVNNANADWDVQLNNQLTLLKNRAAEVDSHAFVVIVVGPVKSGKSTFVNLLSHSRVSPTHYLECTVRPSIISQQKGGSCVITTYAPCGDIDYNVNNNVDYVDLVIDSIKGLPGADMEGIETHEYDLNDENLKQHVELPIDKDLPPGKTTLLTSITANGGPFLGEDIYLVDMPGFDGVRANLGESYYSTIMRRADLVIFIQSSNSSISKISDDFFEMLKKGNSNIPVYLIHNYFESAYWRNSSILQKIIKDQINDAKAEIRGHGFNLSDENCISINLGMVEDSQNADNPDIVVADYSDKIKQYASRFKNTEEDLYKHVSSTQHTTRLQNCLDRIEYEKNRTLDMINERLIMFKEQKKRYDEIDKLFDELKENDILKCDDSSYQLAVNNAYLIDRIEEVVLAFKNCKVDSNHKYKGEEARDIVRRLLDKVSLTIKDELIRCINYDSVMGNVENLTNTRFLNIQLKLVEFMPNKCGELRPIDDFGNDERLFDIDTSIIQSTYNPTMRISGTHLTNRYTKNKINAFIDKATECVVGIEQPAHPNNRINGVLQETIIPETVKLFHEHMVKIVNIRSQHYNDYIERLRISTLQGVIPDLEAHERKLEQLDSLKKGLENVRFA